MKTTLVVLMLIWLITLLAVFKYWQDIELLGEADFRRVWLAVRNLMISGKWPLSQIKKAELQEMMPDCWDEVQLAKRGC